MFGKTMVPSEHSIHWCWLSRATALSLAAVTIRPWAVVVVVEGRCMQCHMVIHADSWTISLAEPYLSHTWDFTRTDTTDRRHRCLILHYSHLQRPALWAVNVSRSPAPCLRFPVGGGFGGILNCLVWLLDSTPGLCPAVRACRVLST